MFVKRTRMTSTKVQCTKVKDILRNTNLYIEQMSMNKKIVLNTFKTVKTSVVKAKGGK